MYRARFEEGKRREREIGKTEARRLMGKEMQSNKINCLSQKLKEGLLTDACLPIDNSGRPKSVVSFLLVS